MTKIEALKIVNKQIEDNDWCNDYQFQHSDYFFLRNLEVSSLGKEKKIRVAFTLEYRTNAHLVYNNIQWDYPYGRVNELDRDINKLELDIMYKTSDPDRTDQVFNKRFNRKLFDARNYKSLGWVIKR